LKYLRRGDHNRILDRVDYDLRVDAFLPADLIDRLKSKFDIL